ncbi:MAG: 4-hydroxythreonine-4-phosphate dehydrogenase PdxA [Arenibacterium sp.]
MTPPVALSCGEPAGIGPEIALKAWHSLRETCPFVWIGDARHLPDGAMFEPVDDPAEAQKVSSFAMPVLQHDFAASVRTGQLDPKNARDVVAVLERAIGLVQDGKASALCTAPIHKKNLMDGAGFAFPGHTEFLAAQAGVDRVVMMLASEALRVVPATIHIALCDVPKVLTPNLLQDTIRITVEGLSDQFGVEAPRLVVAGLNPHAGEDGAMGREELDWIAGTVKDMASQGYNVTGPWPADTLFHAAARVKYDAAIAMYHDQALIPIKTLDFDRGVNVTLGLPFVRTSPDHGTALDIAGTGKANPTSLIEALQMAKRMTDAKAASSRISAA